MLVCTANFSWYYHFIRDLRKKLKCGAQNPVPFAFLDPKSCFPNCAPISAQHIQIKQVPSAMDAQHVQPEARSPKMAVIQMVLQAIQM
jgi:hypothetical protein